MRQIPAKFFSVAITLSMMLLLDTVPAEAAMFDWLFPGRRTTRQYFVVPSGTAGVPVTANFTPSVAQPTTTPMYTTNYWGVQQPHAWFAPQNQHRMMWTPVPVTTFTPAGANGLIPSAGVTWQANRIPVVAFQPTIPGVVPAGSLAPTTAPCTNCPGMTAADTVPTMSFFGSTDAWAPVAPNSGAWTGGAANDWTTVTDSNAGYGSVATPDYTTLYGGTTATPATSVSPWQPVDGMTGEFTGAENATPWQPTDTTSFANSPIPTVENSYSTTPRTNGYPDAYSNGYSDSTNGYSDPQGAGVTPWMPVEESSANGSTRSTDADRPPSITQQRPLEPTPDNSGESAWRAYDQPGGNDSSRYPANDARATNFGFENHAAQQLTPFARPTPEVDRGANDWDFDDKLRLRPREPRSARKPERWQAVPANTSGASPVLRAQRPILDQPASLTRERDEGVWRSVPR